MLVTLTRLQAVATVDKRGLASKKHGLTSDTRRNGRGRQLAKGELNVQRAVRQHARASIS